MPVKRIFAAIDVSDEARRRVSDHASHLRRELADLRVNWVRPENLHITVKFAGSLEEQDLTEFTDAVETVAKRFEPFEVSIGGTGSFVRRRGPGVLWIGIEAAQLVTVMECLNKATLNEGDQPARSPKPHLTIARLKDPRFAGRLCRRHLCSTFEPVKFQVEDIVIYESRLLPTGSVYSRVSRHSLMADRAISPPDIYRPPA